jgi:uncharacterized tellurite resistance protein B-like protein
MFERFRKFLSDVAEGGKHPAHFDHNDYRLAAAALMVHTAEIDGNMAEPERRKLHDLLQRRFELSEAETQVLISEATEAEHEAIDLYHFTTVLNRSLTENDRLRIVQMMWEIIYADGRVSEFESNLIWRAADLLGISSRDRIELGRRAASEQGEPPR